MKLKILILIIYLLYIILTRLNKINNYILDKSIEIQIKLKYFCTSIIQQTLSMCLIIKKKTLKNKFMVNGSFI